MKIVAAHHGPLMTGRAYDGVLFRQCHALASAGHQVSFLFGRTTRDEGALFRYYGREPVQGLNLVQLPMLRRRHWPRLSWNAVLRWACARRVRKLVREGGADVLYMRGVRLTEYLMRRLGAECVPVVFEIHNLAHTEPGSLEARLTEGERFVFENASALLTTTEALARVVTRLARPRGDVVKIPHAADPVSVSSPSPDRTRKRITYVGQLYPLQGLEFVLEALVGLPDCELHLVGGPKRDVERLKALSRELGVGERAVFHCHVPPARVASFMAGADVLVLPSRNAGRMGVVAHTKLYEYLAAGRPIVAVDLPSIAEELGDGVDAVLVRADDPQAFAGGIRRVLEDPGFAGRLAEAARRKSERFTWQARTEKLLEVFTRVID